MVFEILLCDRIRVRRGSGPGTGCIAPHIGEEHGAEMAGREVKHFWGTSWLWQGMIVIKCCQAYDSTMMNLMSHQW